ncbi:hypothetical protein SLA2020_412230 [Shorea laevis]
MKFRYLALFVLLGHLKLSVIEPVTAAAQKAAVSRNPADDLSMGFYDNTCPDVEDIIQQTVGAWIQKDSTLAPSLLRLLFHDCAVRGCDASILLNFTGSERTAFVSSTLREPSSCADILATAAREATILAGGPSWPVPFGRRDGTISLDKEAEMVPHGHENVTTLINFFEAKGLDVSDLVTLSGAHTIGRASCGTFINRVYDFNGTGKPDPSLNTHYLPMLKKRCKRSTDLVHLDVITPTTFDNVYYTNLQRKAGLLTTDQELFSDPKTAASVEAMASQPELFQNQFAVSMIKVQNIEVLTRNEGEVRVNCNFLNSP